MHEICRYVEYHLAVKKKMKSQPMSASANLKNVMLSKKKKKKVVDACAKSGCIYIRGKNPNTRRSIPGRRFLGVRRKGLQLGNGKRASSTLLVMFYFLS